MDTKHLLMLSATISMSVLLLSLGGGLTGHEWAMLPPAYANHEQMRDYAPDWIDDASFKNRVMVVIEHDNVHGSSNVNYPVIISFMQNSLVSTDLVRHPDGHDIRFTLSDGKTLLRHYVESIEQDALDPHASNMTVWFKAPLLSSSNDNVFYMYSNSDTAVDASRPTEVWTNGYTGVYDLSEIGSGNVVKDHSPNANDGTARFQPQLVKSPPFGHGMRLGVDASNVQGPIKVNSFPNAAAAPDVEIAGVPGLNIGTGDFTISAYVLVDEAYENGGDPPILGTHNWNNGDTEGYNINYNNKNFRFTMSDGGGSVGSGHRLNIGTTTGDFMGDRSYMVDVVVDKDSDVKIFVDGVEKASKPLTPELKAADIQSVTNKLYLGDDGTGIFAQYPFSGILTHVTFSDTARSSDWIRTFSDLLNHNPSLAMISTAYADDFPTITLAGQPVVTMEVGSAYVDAGATANDPQEGDITGDIRVDTSALDTKKLGSYTIFYNVQDRNGNNAHTVSRTVNVVDTSPLTFDIQINSPYALHTGNFSRVLELGHNYTSGEFFNLNNIRERVDLTKEYHPADIEGKQPGLGIHTITYKATEPNIGRTYSITETLTVRDTTPPAFDVDGHTADFDTVLELGATYNAKQIRNVVDEQQGLRQSVTYDVSHGSIDGTKPALGDYLVHYATTEHDGDHQTTIITERVTVRDTVPPAFEVFDGTNSHPSGDSNNVIFDTVLELGERYHTKQIRNAVDEQRVQEAVYDGSGINGIRPALGDYLVNYEVKERGGDMLFRHVGERVEVRDTVPPSFDVDGNAGNFDTVLELGATYNAKQIRNVVDEQQGLRQSVTYDVSHGSIDGTQPAVGRYTITYAVTEPGGSSLSRTITETLTVRDTTQPKFNTNGSFMNMGTSVFSLNFTEPIDPNRVDSSAITVGYLDDNNLAHNLFALLDSDMLQNAGGPGSSSVSYKLPEEKRLQIRTLVYPKLTIEFAGNSVYDVNGNEVVLDIHPVNPVRDTVPPELTSADMNMLNGRLEMTFSESVQYRVIPDNARFVSVKGTGNSIVQILPADILRNNADPASAVRVTVQLTEQTRQELSALTAPLDITMERESATDLDINYIARTMVPLNIDDTPPVIDLLGQDPQRIEVGSAYVEPGATAHDFPDGDITGDIVVDISAVNLNVLGSYDVIYTVSDSTGQQAQKIRTVQIVDTTPPAITLVGESPINLDHNSQYVDAGATALDSHYGDITGDIVVINPVDTGTAGIYVITYDVADRSGNAAAQVTRVVNVAGPPSGGGSSGDTVPPSISVSFDDDEYPLEFGGQKYNRPSVDHIPLYTAKAGQELKTTLRVYENSGPANVVHAEMYISHHGNRIKNDLTETAIIWDRQQGFRIADPHGIIGAANVTNTVQGNKAVFEFTVTPKDEISQSDVLFRLWDVKRNAMYLHLPDVLKVQGSAESAILPSATTSDDTASAPSAVPDDDRQSTKKHDALQTTPPESSQPSAPPAGTSATDTWSDTQMSVLKRWGGYDAETASDGDVLSEFGIKGVKVPAYVKDVVKFVLNDQVALEEFTNMLQYLEAKGMLSDVDKSGSFPGIEPQSYQHAKPSALPQTYYPLHFEHGKTEPNSKAGLGDLKDKLGILRALGNNEIIQTRLAESNAEFGAMDDPGSLMDQRDAEWLRNPPAVVTPFMESLMDSEPALIAKAIVENDVDSRVPIIGITITNAYGANVIITERTQDYKQSDEQWWSKTKADGSHIMSGSGSQEHTGLDAFEVSSIITDSKGDFIGIIKAAVNFEKSRLSN